MFRSNQNFFAPPKRPHFIIVQYHNLIQRLFLPNNYIKLLCHVLMYVTQEVILSYFVVIHFYSNFDFQGSFVNEIAYLIDDDLLSSDVELEKLVQHKSLLHNCKYLLHVCFYRNQQSNLSTQLYSCLWMGFQVFGIIRSSATIFLFLPKIHKEKGINQTIKREFLVLKYVFLTPFNC